MSYLGNKYAGMRIVGRSDSWYEPEDDSAYEKAYEFIVEWINDNTTIPDTSLTNADLDTLVEEYLRDPEVLTDELAVSLQQSWNEYCATNHELGKAK